MEDSGYLRGKQNEETMGTTDRVQTGSGHAREVFIFFFFVRCLTEF